MNTQRDMFGELAEPKLLKSRQPKSQPKKPSAESFAAKQARSRHAEIELYSERQLHALIAERDVTYSRAGTGERNLIWLAKFAHQLEGRRVLAIVNYTCICSCRCFADNRKLYVGTLGYRACCRRSCDKQLACDCRGASGHMLAGGWGDYRLVELA